MGFIGKIFKNKQIVTIVSLILCFGILVFAYRYRVNKAIEAVSIPIATRDLKAREEIKPDCFETRKVAQSMLTENVITSVSELVPGNDAPAKYVNYNTFIPEGSMFYRSAVTTWDHMPDSIWSDLPDGQTVFSLPVNATTTYGNSIYPGDKIDLYFQGKEDGTGKYFVGPLIKGITVLAVKDDNGSHIFNRSAEQKNAAALIFAVENDEFLFLKDAILVAGNGGLFPVPRNANYNITAEEEKGSDYIRKFVTTHSKVSTDDKEIKSESTVNNVTE